MQLNGVFVSNKYNFYCVIMYHNLNVCSSSVPKDDKKGKKKKPNKKQNGIVHFVPGMQTYKHVWLEFVRLGLRRLQTLYD